MGRQAEQCHVKITTGREEVDNRRPCNLRPITLDKLLKWIDRQNVDNGVKEELKASASTYPNQALATWQKNYINHVTVARAKLNKNPKPKPPMVELGDEPMEMKENGKESFKYDDFADLIDEFENPSGYQG